MFLAIDVWADEPMRIIRRILSHRLPSACRFRNGAVSYSACFLRPLALLAETVPAEW